MATDDYGTKALLEHRFCLQILGDHSRFFYHALSPTESEELQRSNMLINEFDQLLADSRKNLSLNEIHSLTSRASQFMDFLKEIDELIFKNELLGTLNPLFPDHMLREECYYLMKLAQASTTPSPPCDPTKPRKIEKI